MNHRDTKTQRRSNQLFSLCCGEISEKSSRLDQKLKSSSTKLLGAATNDRIGLGLPRTPIRGRSAKTSMAGNVGATQNEDIGEHYTKTVTFHREG